MKTHVEISKRLILINSASSIVARVLNIVVLVWLYQHLLRRITPEEYALYPVLMGVMEFAPVLTAILTGGLGRYIVEAYANGDERRVTQITSTMFPLLLLAAVPVLIGGGLFTWNVAHILKVAPERVWDARVMMGLMVLSLGVRLPLAPFTVGLYVRQRFVLNNMLAVCAQLLRIALLFTLLFGVSTRVLWLVVATVSANSCQLIATFVFSRRLVPALKFRLSEVRWPVVREVTAFGVWNYVARIGKLIYEAGDVIILNKLGTALDVSSFHIGSLIQRHVLDATDVVSAPLLPALTALYAKGDKTRFRAAFLRGGKYALWLVMPIALPAAVFRNELVTLYVGDRYRAAATVIAMLTLSLLTTISTVLTGMLAHAAAQMRAYASCSIALQILNVGLTLYLVGRMHWGAVGAALSTLVVLGIGTPLLMWPLGLRLADVSFDDWYRQALRPGALPGILSLPLWIAAQYVLHPTTWTVLAASSAIGLIAYIGIVAAFFLTTPERQILGRFVSRARRQVGMSRP